MAKKEEKTAPDVTTKPVETPDTPEIPEGEGEFDPKTWVRDGLTESVSWVSDGFKGSGEWVKTGVEGVRQTAQSKRPKWDNTEVSETWEEFSGHMRKARREILLGFKSVIDSALDKLEEK